MSAEQTPKKKIIIKKKATGNTVIKKKKSAGGPVIKKKKSKGTVIKKTSKKSLSKSKTSSPSALVAGDPIPKEAPAKETPAKEPILAEETATLPPKEPEVPAPEKEDAKSTSAELAPLTDEPETERKPETFTFHCPYCSKPVEATHNQVEQQASCASCGNPVWVPPPLATPTKGKAPESLIKFFCSVCGQKLSAKNEQAGAHTVCPACNSSITVPELQPPPPEDPPVEEDNDTPKSKKAPAGMFNFDCSSCGKTFQAKKGWSGRRFKCPSCSENVTVP